MASFDLLSSGIATVRQGQHRAHVAGAEIARSGVPVAAGASPATPLPPAASAPVESHRPVNLINGLVELHQAQRDVEAGAAVIHTADDVLGTVIDITA